ncbi:capsule polysaccharide export protein [Pseudarthrobacter phenanthrenivorans Sphe3]|uniref:Capsule polysaccharide export protein n=1 Tax=Pseudarthrobacter phenanthrenivorans (strain DSM 18606 / JCM 16027 / LMG 23796 / Sphe3) TaxID=930171 RepID=F0M1H8_PSEPM|nr:capsule polysaccharide export protein [Pseudarthrobacter phenanthrenivorans]ADX74174.1 capsule polysaccharide export protein [Pseudarthrobacter phenanthrenivorans Sphe3]
MAGRSQPSMARLLFVAVGESEVPAFESIAEHLGAEGSETRLVTWLPRLAAPRTESLERMLPSLPPPRTDAAEVFAGCGISDPSMAADYDRDWHFATVGQKTKHVRNVYSALADVYDEFKPDLVVSSVGGETTRVVSDVIARARGVQTAYFNAVPIPGRFTLLRSMDAPFVPYEGSNTSYRPLRRASNEPRQISGVNGQSPQASSPLEGIERLWAQTVGREKSYPVSWIPRKTAAVVKQAALSRWKTKSGEYKAEHVKVLYPLHDERDFQVAVRERHAIPQANLLAYVSSSLPPGFHLYVKPHPEHAAAHHTLLWRDLVNRPNITFLPPEMSAKEAIQKSDVIFTLASSLGFEAIQAGKPVVCYGRPFYGNRGLTLDVDDPRQISKAIQEAQNTKPDQQAVDELRSTMTSWSWQGRFTPLDLAPANLRELADAVKEVILQL